MGQFGEVMFIRYPWTRQNKEPTMRTFCKSLLIAVLLTVVGISASAEGYRTALIDGERQIPVCVVKGAPYEMGKALGLLMKDEANAMVTRILAAAQMAGGDEFSDAALDKVWNITAPHISPRFKEELRGVAEGAGLPLEVLQRMHTIPLVQEYSCSSVAVWGEATALGDLFLTRNLDWVMALRAHDFPCLVLYLPDEGIPHVNVSFAGYIGSNTGFNAAGIALAEMGNSSGRDKPYDLDGYHFTMFFRDILYDAKTLEQALDVIRNAKRIKKYHYVIGSGKEGKGAKVVAHAPNLKIWRDNDPNDELAPNVMPNSVYEDEGRGAFPYLKKDYGKHTAQTIIDISKAIPIKGGNVLDAVYNATTFEMWITYAQGETEAYTLPYLHFNPRALLDFDAPTLPVLAKTDGVTLEMITGISCSTRLSTDPGWGVLDKEKK
jgi:isopenicillin-N N-acyltransferase like protein